MQLRASVDAERSSRWVVLALTVAIAGHRLTACDARGRQHARSPPEEHPSNGVVETSSGRKDLIKRKLSNSDVSFFALGRLTSTKENPRHYIFLPGGVVVPVPVPGVVCLGPIAYDIENKFLYANDVQLWMGDAIMKNATFACASPPKYAQFLKDIATGRFVPVSGIFYGLTPDQQVLAYDTANDELNVLGVKQGWMDTDVPTTAHYPDHFIVVSPTVGDGATIYRFSTETGERSVWGSALNPKEHRVLGLFQGDVQTVALLSNPSADPLAHPTVRVVGNDGSEQVVVTSPLPNGAAIRNPEFTRDNTLYLGATSTEEGKGGIFRVDPGGVLQQVACAKEIWWMLLLD